MKEFPSCDTLDDKHITREATQREIFINDVHLLSPHSRRVHSDADFEMFICIGNSP
jgi:hypothetical protein